MTPRSDIAQVQDALVEAVAEGNESRARTLISQLGKQSPAARALLEAMLSSSDARSRQAAAFGLGELGGAASARRLEQQLAIEEARGDYDGASVIEAITDALGRIADTTARSSLVRRLERIASRPAEPLDAHALARALWRKRHPELIPAIQRAGELLSEPAAASLRALQQLLESTPESLSAWVSSPAVPVADKTEVLTVLEEEVPDELLAVMPAFISTANALASAAAGQRGATSYYCDRLFILLLRHWERLMPALPQDALSTLRATARVLVAAVSLGCAIRAATVLQRIGLPEDAALLEAHRPSDATLARVFDDAAQALRSLTAKK